MLSRLSSFSGPLSKLFTSIKDFTLSGLILRYEISDRDSYSGTTTVTDLVGSSNATLINGATYSINGYLNFDGVNDYLFTNTSLNPKLSPVNTSTIISFFVWVYPTDNGVIINEQGSSTLDLSWFDSQLEIVSGSLKFRVWPGSALTSTIPISFYKWYYLGLTYDGTKMSGYVNGQFAGSYNISRQTPYNDSFGKGLYYALASSAATNLGDGTNSKLKLGAFHVYKTALSQQQILNNYNATKSNYIVTASMSIWIDANDPGSYPGSGTSVTDLSGNGYTHTLAASVPVITTFGFKSFDCNAFTNNYIRVNGTGPILSTTGYTYTTWARISPSSTYYRTLFRSAPNDHALLVNIGTDNLGFFDNDTNTFRDSGYDVTSIEEKWVQYSVVGDSSSTVFYINDVQVGSVSFGAGGNRHDYFGSIDNQPFGYVGNMMLYNKKLTQLEIKQNYDALKNVYLNGDIVVSNLKLYFNPSNLLSYTGTGSNITDLSGNSLNGAMSNVLFTNPYLIFNGSNSQVTITDNALLEPGTGDWTLEVWFNQTNASGSQVILGKFDPGGGAQDVSYAIRIINGNVRLDFGNGVTSVITVNYLTTPGITYHLTYVFNNVANNNIITYVNGVQQATTTHSFASVLNTSANLYLGSYNNGEYPQYFNGKIGIVRLYSSALTASDVSKNFEANRGIYGI